jgi:ubiquinone/menaquinone biosynthesis C-methylase UbiE
MTASTQWQLAQEAAERYESILVPAILGPFAEALVDRVDIRPGDVVLDVGCGTGAAARFAAARAGVSGRVVGIDVNAGMLAVARTIPASAGSAPLEWHEADACALPVEDASADVALCAQTIQFLPERGRALGEMRRTLRPGGHLAASVWCPLDDNPYFESLVRAMEQRIGSDTAKGLRAAFGLANADELKALVADAGFDDVVSTSATLNLELPPLSEFVPRHISATPMAAGYAAATENARAAVIRDVVEGMARYGAATGARIPFRSHVAIGIKR